ncbi:hypothetical protein GCM10010394_52570 [Streptomyces crystallinus]|uniref:Lipoprotein n=1 Tax=Streptomyces crystallinus TaxID=68191 RepID=A0ABN1GPT8_9ACTN
MGRLTRPAPAACALTAVAMLIGAVGCSGGDGDSDAAPKAATRSPTPSASKSITPPTGRPEHIDGQTVTRAPKPMGNGKVLTSVNSRNGNAELPLGKIHSGRLAVQVNCQGSGKISVAIDPSGLSFPLECVAAESSSTYNEVHLKTDRSEGALHITAPSTVRWALTVEQ